MLSLMPVIVRSIIAVVQDPVPNVVLDPGDLIGFIIALAVTNINLLEHESKVEPKFKTTVIGLSLTHFAIAAALFATLSFGATKTISLSRPKLLMATILISFSSLLLSFVSADRLAKIHLTEGADS